MLNNRLKNNLVNRKYNRIINEINLIEQDLLTLNNSELRTKIFKLQKQYSETKNLNSLIQKSFALTREASYRTIGLRHFDVQLIGGLVLNSNKIAEMKTGEGKTLVATLPATLNALTKKGVHIVTVNQYLANRDQISMGQIYRFLGLDTGLIRSGMTQKNRQKNYQSDITYLTNYELTFDYLRDNLKVSLADVALRELNYCIIDEVDSILIDEAQTPLIISKPDKERDNEKYIIASEAVKYLEINNDYTVDEKNKNVILTELGSRKIEQLIQVSDLYDRQDPWIPYIINALKALTLFFNNIHYIIQKNRIIIVDEFTGRIMVGRRWGDGLHQAIEAKEELTIRPKSKIEAEITYQNFFLLYPKLSGMTGTGKTAEIEFKKIYNLLVDVIPTAKPPKRKDLPDLIYKDQFSKWDAITRFCDKISSIGQPILIGTTTVEKSEMLAQILSEYKLDYQILNAKPENVRQESQIVAQAGKSKNITIATNMAGRGTDIILGGNINFDAQKNLYDLLVTAKKTINKVNNYKQLSKREKRYQILKNLNILKIFRTTIGCSHKFYSVLLSLADGSKFFTLSDINILKLLQENDRIAIPRIQSQCVIRFLLNELLGTIKKYHAQENQDVKNLGGLCVIGTERNNSRRVDNQLRGRCGRQGDPGSSHFFLSLDDNLFRLYGGINSRMVNLLKNQISDDSPLESKILTRGLDSAQQKVEERAFEQRKSLFDYDEILDQQRKITYFERKSALENEQFDINVVGLIEQLISDYFQSNNPITQNMVFSFIKLYKNIFGHEFENSVNLNFHSLAELKQYFYQEFWLQYQKGVKEGNVGNRKNVRVLRREIYLNHIDETWQEHLQKTSLLREAVGWRGYAQVNPLTEYKREAYKMFCQKQEEVLLLTVYSIIRAKLV